MTTYADAEQARLRAVAALRAAGLTEHAEHLAALPPITDSETATAAARAADAAAWDAAAADAAAYDAYTVARAAAWDDATEAAADAAWDVAWTDAASKEPER